MVCGTLIGLGCFTSYAAFVASGEMASAYFIVHFPKAELPILNRGDTAALFPWAWLYVCIRGGGKWSLDRLHEKPGRDEVGVPDDDDK